MSKARGKQPAPARERIEKAELFAYAYIRSMGNGKAAASEVYGIDGNSAASRASQLLTNTNVQKIIGEFLDAQRESLKKFSEQGNYYLTIVAQKLIQIITNEKTSTDDCFEAMEKLLRLGGFEISEQVTIAKISAKEATARGRAQLPGLAAPGSQPGALPAGTTIQDNRKTLFLLSPPPLPPGGVPTPALQKQWEEMGWVPGVVDAKKPADNAAHAVPRGSDRRRSK